MKRPSSRDDGVALVVTVIVVAMLAVVGVALMQSVTADRAASRSVANYARAQLAAEAGVGMAGALLVSQMTNDHFIVVANTDRQIFVGNGSNQPAGSFAYTPAFSTVNSVTSAVTPIVSAGIPATNPPAGPNTTNFTFTNLPGGLSVTSPPAISWVYLTNASGQTNARFAFWVEDLGGRLDLSVVGTNTSSPAARRPTGTNPAEIALWALFNSNAVSATNGVTNKASDDLVIGRSNILTAATARLVSADVTTNHLADLASNLRHDTNEPELIPFGFGYTDQGRAKFNLNTNLATLANISGAITRNLTNFSQRAGAMNGTNYINGLAASIIDYADGNANPTVDNQANPSYLGIENIPWPNELFDQIVFVNVTDAGLVRLQLQDWLEVWNMGDKPIANSTVSISNNYDIILTFSNSVLNASFKANLKDANFETGSLGNRDFNVASLQPNEYRVFASETAPAARTLSFAIPNAAWVTTNAAVKSQWRVWPALADETKNMTYKAFLGNTLIQHSKGGRWPRYVTTSQAMRPRPATPNAFVFANPIGFASQTGPSSAASVPAHSGGDPRAQLFLSDPLRSQNYTNRFSSPGGRNWEAQNIGTYPESEVNPVRFWPDSGHITAADRGGNPTSYSQNPDSFPRSATTNNFVMRRNDTGSYSNIFELGRIYDPLQWADATARPTGVAANQPGIWTNLTAAATPDARFGGRNTLRIGRWEFSRFTNDGSRASQLLDLFAVAPPGGAGPVTNRVAGRINLNTASTNVLRALAAGVAHTADPALVPSSSSPVPIFYIPVNAVNAFATGVINRRNQKPFFSAAELPLISTNTNASSWPSSAVFGSSNLATITEWNDSAAEEWFARVYPLSTVRSRNFAVYAVGQALQPGTTNMLSTSRAIFQIYVNPLRDTGGLTTNVSVQVVQSWNL